MSEIVLESWHDVLSRRSAWEKPWLILPEAPQLSGGHRAISYRELYELSSRCARALRVIHSDAARVAVIADSSAECCICLLGVLLSGLTLVPVAPRSLSRDDAACGRDMLSLLQECSPVLLLGSEAALRGLELGPEVVALAFGALLRGAPGARTASISAQEMSSVGLWQYTSGTTRRPRAVELTHANILQNVLGIGQTIEATARDVGATWLPLFHDMGLVGSLLFSTYWGMSLVLMPPRMFLGRPETWLWAISRFAVTCSAAPNSAYEICASKLDTRKLSGLNLASWRVAFNGAELVHAATVERFCRQFADYGFRSAAMYPVYGLAEHTVAATLPRLVAGAMMDHVVGEALDTERVARPAAPSACTRTIVAVGNALPGHALRLVDDEGQVIRLARTVGEIQLRGPSAMLGYRGAVESFTPDGWLSTGDLGYLAEGNLYIVGRRKHMIKRGGQMIDAALIENAARTVEGVRAGVVTAFGVPDDVTGTERLVVLAEAARLEPVQQLQLQRAIARAVLDVAAIAPDAIELVAPGSIPRTTSGKVRHSVARQRYIGAAR